MSRTATHATAIVVLGLLLSCGGMATLREELKDPDKTLRVLVESIPSGAEVYGIKKGKPGTLLGTTPFVCSYMVVRSGTDPDIISNVPVQETIVSDFDILEVAGGGRASHKFHCVVTMEGHQTAVVERELVERGPADSKNFSTSDVFKGGRTVDIFVPLPPLPADSGDAGE